MTYPRHASAPVACWRVRAFHLIPAPLARPLEHAIPPLACWRVRAFHLIPAPLARPLEQQGGSSPDRLRMLPSTHGVDLPERIKPSPGTCRRRGGVGLRGVRGMDAAAKPTRTYLRRPRNPTPPRPPTDSPLWTLTLTLTLTLLWLVAGAGRSPASNPHANSGACRCSSRNNAALVSRPPPKPVNVPLLPITRWHGSTIGNGLRPLAAPTARVAVG